jgi:soluble lytic murein transglycosylase-like protein
MGSAAAGAARPGRATATPTAQATRLAMPRALGLAAQVDEAASRQGIDPLLMHAIAHVESGHRAQAVSSAGALGLMQLMPATARDQGVTVAASLQDPRTNLAAAAGHLKSLQRRYGNDLPLVLAAYNAGQGAVDRHGRQVPPYPETRRYVRAVLSTYQGLRDAAH